MLVINEMAFEVRLSEASKRLHSENPDCDERILEGALRSELFYLVCQEGVFESEFDDGAVEKAYSNIASWLKEEDTSLVGKSLREIANMLAGDIRPAAMYCLMIVAARHMEKA